LGLIILIDNRKKDLHDKYGTLTIDVIETKLQLIALANLYK